MIQFSVWAIFACRIVIFNKVTAAGCYCHNWCNIYRCYIAIFLFARSLLILTLLFPLQKLLLSNVAVTIAGLALWQRGRCTVEITAIMTRTLRTFACRSENISRWFSPGSWDLDYCNTLTLETGTFALVTFCVLLLTFYLPSLTSYLPGLAFSGSFKVTALIFNPLLSSRLEIFQSDVT